MSLIYNAHSPQFHWNELAMEMMRDATAIVAVVSAPQYPFRSWVTLPDLIASGTNLRATAVVVTMIDGAHFAWDNDSEWQEFKEDIKHAFWRESKTNPSDGGILLTCSAAVGESLRSMKKELEGKSEKPELNHLWSAPRRRVSQI
jgi:hypothetical protein